MRISINELKQIIRNVILETVDEDGELLDVTHTDPDEEAPEGALLGEPYLSDLEQERIDNKEEKQEKKKERENLNDNQDDEGQFELSKRQKKRKLADELYSGIDDEAHAIVGAIGPVGSGNGPGEKPYKQKVLKPKNAMGKRRKSRK
tara:strand:+ start:142 stop:582 length:441 start_codon:yes stop_codon:yes gene_type:complete